MEYLLVTEPMGQGVDTECCLLDEEYSQDASVDEAAPPIAPSKTSNKHGEANAHEEYRLDVIAVLPNDNGVIIKIRDISTADPLRILLHDHPPKVRV